MHDRLLTAFWITACVFGTSLALRWGVGQMVTGIILLLLVALLGYRALVRSLVHH